MAKFSYKMGDIFAFPLRDGKGYCLGVIAGMPKNGKVLLGYFYEKVYSSIPFGDEVPDLEPDDAFRIWRFGDLSLFNGEWPVVGHVADFDSLEWPSPKFLRESMRQLITYANDDPQRETNVERYTADGNYEKDGLKGAGAVEIAMTQILEQENQ